jgi:hypothetical protein
LRFRRWLFHPADRLPVARWFALLSLVALSLFSWRGSPAEEGVHAHAGPLPAGASAPAFAASGSPARPAPGADVSATTVLTPTLFLPIVAREGWLPPDSILGVQLLEKSIGQEAVDKMGEAGARWTRLNFFWSHVESTNTTPDNYKWSAALDESLARLSAEGVSPILTIVGNPSWAASHPAGPTDLVDIGELVEFVTAAVARYGQPPYNVKHWEFYNEPDNGSEYYAGLGWGYWGNEPAAYAAMLAAVYQPIKDVDPEARIVFGGLACDNWTDGGGPFVRDFLDGVLQAGGGKYFDIMNFHYYSLFDPNWAPYGLGIIGKATYLRDKLASYGVDKPLICTETTSMSLDPELQSRYVPQIYARSMAADLSVTLWYHFIDRDDPSPDKPALLHPDLTPKPAYHAFSTVARQLAGVDYVRLLSVSETGSDQIEAHEFALPDDATRIIVAWTHDEQQHEMRLTAGHLVLVDKFGAQTSVTDADDGAIDGSVWVTIPPSPVYLRIPH